MNVDQAVELVRQCLILMLLLGAPILMAAVTIGLIISIFQAVTQIHEQTLTFVPKIVVMGVVTIMLTPWLTTQILQFAERMFGTMS